MRTSLVSATSALIPQGQGDEVKDFCGEEIIVYCARVSSDRDNKFEEPDKLLNYLIKHEHWSPFEMANMCVEIVTSRAIARQILRHRSFSFQEFSQRYSDDIKFELPELRFAGSTNRQGSLDEPAPEFTLVGFRGTVAKIYYTYKLLLKMGVAPECARMILPECTQTTLYMNGSIRSWIHYLDIRTGDDTQKEHREVALSIRDTIFIKEFPIISKALGWIKNTTSEEQT